MATTTDIQARERADLLESLGRHRFFLRFTAQGLTDEQAATTSTISSLNISGLIKHVAQNETRWLDFIEQGAVAFAGASEEWSGSDPTARFRLDPGDNLADALQHLDDVAARTEQVIRTIADLDADSALPEAPWFEPGARWSARRVLLHLIAETAQHAGHADIIREAIDGQRTMG
jgi:hypothetical protein